MTGIHISPSDLDKSGGTLDSLGSKLHQGGQSLSSAGERLSSAASEDKSGFGKVITNAFGKGLGVAGKVFTEGGGWAQRAGKTMKDNGQNHRENEEHQAKTFGGIKPEDKATHNPHGEKTGGSSGTSTSSASGKSYDYKGFSEKGDKSGIGDHNSNPGKNSTGSKDLPTCGDPIDVSTGRMVLTQTDVELAGVLPLLFSRTHRSDYRLGRSFGTSWAATVDQRIEVGDDAIHFAVEDGSLLRYPLPTAPDEAVLPAVGPRWPLVRTDDGGAAIAVPAEDQVRHFGADGLLRAVQDGYGHRIEIDRDAAGTPTAVRHSAGHLLELASEQGRITALRLSAAGAETPIELMTYGYDERGRLVQVINSAGQPLTFDYDDADRIVRWVDRNGMFYDYEFDADGRCVRAGGAEDFLKYALAYRVDEQGNRFTHATDSLGATTTYLLDENFHVAAETDALGNTTRSTWDSAGQLLSRTDPLGRTTGYEYDVAGNLVRLTRPDGSQLVTEYDAQGHEISAVEPDGSVWRREYDEEGLLAALIDPVGARTGYDYDERGHLVAVTDPAGNVTRFEVNAAGLPLTVTEPLGGTTRYEYDLFGRVISVTDPVGNVTSTAWTIEGSPLRQTLPDGTVRQWAYDGEGNVRQSVDAAGRVARTEIAHFDLPVAEIAPDGSRLAYAYDTELRLVSVTNEQGRVWRYEHDPLGNVVRETDFNGRVVQNSYDAAGQLVQRVNGVGQVTTFGYDVLGRMVVRDSAGERATFDYDAGGRLLRAVNADAEVAFGYDRMGRPVSESVNGRVVASGYDALGRRVLRRTPSGAESRWEYDENSRAVALRTAGRTVQFGYDAAGREVHRQLGSGAALAQTWDGNNRITGQVVLTQAQPATLVQQRGYRYSPDGLLSDVYDSASGSREYRLDAAGRVADVRGPNLAEHYDYDPAGNIAAAQWPALDPDSVAAQAVGPREYDGTRLRRAGNVRYEHDAQGRMVLRQSKTLSSAPRTWHYAWNADDRLVGVSTPDGQRWRYRYDVFGRRIAKQRLTQDGQGVAEQVDFTWDGYELVEQVHNGTEATVWDWDPASYRALTQVSRSLADQRWVDRQFYAIVTDLIGTPSELVDDAGNVAWRGRDGLWGQRQPAPDGAVDTPLRFPGQYHDRETGLHYNMQRYYDPVAGRYASMDPLGLEPSPNPQAYVPNPTNWIDPMGLTPCTDAKTTVYRVEIPPKLDSTGKKVPGKEGNILLKPQGDNMTVPSNKTLYLNFGSAKRANEYLQKRYDQQAEGAHIKSFEVPTSYVNQLRNNAISEHDLSQLRRAAKAPGATPEAKQAYEDANKQPLIADPTKADDQYGLKASQLNGLRNAIIPGSGKVWSGFVPDNE
jgi:RHS repeat-associated protein